MTQFPVRVDLTLDRIEVYDEADGIGSAQPYLWTVFFKVDGDTVSVTDSLTLSGRPTVYTTPGSRGNLGVEDVSEGDTIPIPSSIGSWQTKLKPIPLPSPLSEFTDDPGGTIGVVTVLMEDDNVSDDGKEAGHRALNAEVEKALQEIIDTRTLTDRGVTDEDISGLTDEVKAEVRKAIREQQSDLENLWSWSNEDDTIGTEVFFFDQDDLIPGSEIEFSKRWQNEGDWELFGHLTVHPLEAVAVPPTAEVPRAFPKIEPLQDGQFLPPEVFELEWPFV